MRRSRAVAATVLGTVLVVLGTCVAWSASAPGRVSAPDATLRPGCHHYRYHYVVTPATDDWELRTRLYDPRGKERGEGYFLLGADPLDNHPSFTICRADVVPGRFTIRARLTWYDDPVLPILPATVHHARLAPAHFRLTRP
jgi:hypothetical protein